MLGVALQGVQPVLQLRRRDRSVGAQLAAVQVKVETKEVAAAEKGQALVVAPLALVVAPLALVVAPLALVVPFTAPGMS
jgi:hypothetical protein